MIKYNAPQNWTFPELETLAMKEKGSIRIGPFGSALKKNEYSNEGIRVLGIEHVLPNNLVWKVPKYIPLKKYAELTQYTVKVNDILVTNMGTVGRTCVFPKGFGKSIISSHLVKVTIDPKVCDPKYLSWMLNFCPIVTAQIKAKCHGAIMAGFNTSLLKSLKIPLPPLDIQKKIATILDKAKQLRQKRKQAIEKLDQLLQSVFLDMFGEPVKNPKGWKILKFGDVGRLERGKSKHRPRNAPELLGGPHPLIQTGDVANSGGYIRKYNQTYSELGLKQSRMWPKGTLCITIAANIAKTGILTFDSCFPDSVVGFTPDENVTIEYVQSWMSFLQEVLEKTAPESAQKNINLKILSELDIPVPPIKLQDKFSKIVKKIETEKLIYNTIESKLNNLFNSLLQRAFKGELKFNDKAFKELEQTMT